MELINSRKGSKISIWAKEPQGGPCHYGFSVYELKIYSNNMLVIEQDSPEDHRYTWIPTSEVLRIEECLYKIESQDPLQPQI